MRKAAVLTLFASVLGLSPVFAHKREHGSHVHGQGKISLAFEEASGSIDMEVPAEVLFGFEHQAKTEKDKKTQADALAKLEASIAEMIQFDAGLGCVIKKKSIEVSAEEEAEKKGSHGEHAHGEHRDVDAEFDVTCQKSPLNSKIVFNLQKHFPRFKKAEVQALIGSVQKQIQVKQNGASLELK